MSLPEIKSLPGGVVGDADRPSGPELLRRSAAFSDEEVVERVLAGDTGLFEVIVRRYNQRLYRVAYSILGHKDEAEDVMQEAYVRAFHKLAQFEGRAKFSTWLTRIAVYEASARARRSRRLVPIDTGGREDGTEGLLARRPSPGPSPEEHVGNRELRGVLTEAVEELPEIYRVAFVLRDVEGLDTAETAASLGISETAAKVRLHRARRMLRDSVERRVGDEVQGLFEFHLRRCDRIVAGVFARIAATAPDAEPGAAG